MPNTSPSNRRLQVVAIAVVGAVAISLRGNYLLGPAYGTLCAALMLALVWLLTRSLKADEGTSRVRVALVLLFATTVGLTLAFPASVNGDVKHLIKKHAIDRLAHKELLTVLKSDPSFRDLAVSSRQLKIVNVYLRGSVATRNDFDRLRSRISKECPTVRGCFLHWDVLLRDSQACVDDTDRPEPPKPQT